jgi:hypothetical protein
MIRPLPLLIIGLFLMGSGIPTIGQPDAISPDHIVETMTLFHPIISDVGEYMTVTLPEKTSQTGEPGAPDLPALTRLYILPYGSSLETIDVTYGDVHEYLLPKHVQPVPEFTPTNSDSSTPSFSPDKDIYTSSNRYPPQAYTYTLGAGLDHEEPVLYLSLQCYPLRYSPQEQTLISYETIQIDITYEKQNTPLILADTYDLVIIAPSKFSNSLQPLIDHKNKYGVATLLQTTEDILATYEGRDPPEQIKYFIKYARETWGVDYILLVGDMDRVPMRITDVKWPGVFSEMPCDLYYADLYDAEGKFSSWDSNNNDKFSEYNFNTDFTMDSVDLYPDIHVGRLPCKTNRDVTTMVNKICTYETSTYGKEWFDRIILMGGDTFPTWGVYEGEVVTYHVEQTMQEFESLRLWTSQQTYTPRSINQAISSGAGFVSYSGHGYEFGFGTSPPHEDQRIEYYFPYLLGLTNAEKLPIVFFDACSTAHLDYAFHGLPFPCFAWSIVKKPAGGAIASLGATRVAFCNTDERGPHGGAGLLNMGFFEAYEPGVSVGQMLTQGINYYINLGWKDYLTLEEFVLIGDPSLKVGGYP